MKALRLVSVLVRTCNDAAYIRRTLAAVFAQRLDVPFEVLVCIDRSEDGTKEIAAEFPRIRYVERPAGEYRPANTLNAMVAAAQGEIVVFNNADAIPQNGDWLAALIAPLREGRADAVYANQLPRPDASWLVKKDSWRAFGDGKIEAGWRFFFSLASSAAFRGDLLANPFDPRMKYSEDVEWAHRRAGFRIVYAANAKVEHSHDYTFAQLAKRFRGEGEADAVIFGGAAPSLWRALLGAAREALRDFVFLLPHPSGWHEFPLAFPRRLVQRFAYRRGWLRGLS